MLASNNLIRQQVKIKATLRYVRKQNVIQINSTINLTETYRTPIDDELSGQAKNRIAGKYRDNPAFQDMMMML